MKNDEIVVFSICGSAVYTSDALWRNRNLEIYNLPLFLHAQGHGEWRGDRDRARGWCPNEKDYQRPGPSTELQAQVEGRKGLVRVSPCRHCICPCAGPCLGCIQMTPCSSSHAYPLDNWREDSCVSKMCVVGSCAHVCVNAFWFLFLLFSSSVFRLRTIFLFQLSAFIFIFICVSAL